MVSILTRKRLSQVIYVGKVGLYLTKIGAGYNQCQIKQLIFCQPCQFIGSYCKSCLFIEVEYFITAIAVGYMGKIYVV